LEETIHLPLNVEDRVFVEKENNIPIYLESNKCIGFTRIFYCLC